MEPLTWDVARAALENFFSEKPFVLFATGTSCALDGQFSMPALERHLKQELPPELNETQKQEWEAVLSALGREPQNFEKAMDCISDEELTQKIVNYTGRFVAEQDQKYASKILVGNERWPAALMLKTLFDRYTRGGDTNFHCATPNYDLLGEYAFCHAKIPYVTGFSGGFCRELNWKKAISEVVGFKPSGRRRQLSKIETPHIRLYKPHGSLNTFSIKERIVQCDAWINSPPEHVQRSMITPGTAKYERLHHHRSDLLTQYDKAVESHSRFLFLGFGFNDSQLVNSTFRQKLQEDGCEGLIITKDSNKRIEDWLEKSPNLWLVCKQSNNDYTRIRNSRYDGWLKLSGRQLWVFDNFTKDILGD